MLHLRGICLKWTYPVTREMYRSSDGPTSQCFILRSVHDLAGSETDQNCSSKPCLTLHLHLHAQTVLIECFGVHYYPHQKHEPQILTLQNVLIQRRSLTTMEAVSLFRRWFVGSVVLKAFIPGTLYYLIRKRCSQMEYRFYYVVFETLERYHELPVVKTSVDLIAVNNRV
jgi:hypothetical protein